MPGSRVAENSRAYLEHLDVRDAEVEISGVAEDEAAAEEQADREDGLDEHLLRHTDVLGSVQQMGRSLEDTCPNSL